MHKCQLQTLKYINFRYYFCILFDIAILYFGWKINKCWVTHGKGIALSFHILFTIGPILRPKVARLKE